MKNLEDQTTKIFPSTTRGGKELPSSSALDSPSVLNKLATPKPASAINSDMSHVIDDATSAMHDTYDETTNEGYSSVEFVLCNNCRLTLCDECVNNYMICENCSNRITPTL